VESFSEGVLGSGKEQGRDFYRGRGRSERGGRVGNGQL
jgi:hypothetical protein